MDQPTVSPPPLCGCTATVICAPCLASDCDIEPTREYHYCQAWIQSLGPPTCRCGRMLHEYEDIVWGDSDGDPIGFTYDLQAANDTDAGYLNGSLGEARPAHDVIYWSKRDSSYIVRVAGACQPDPVAVAQAMVGNLPQFADLPAADVLDVFRANGFVWDGTTWIIAEDQP